MTRVGLLASLSILVTTLIWSRPAGARFDQATNTRPPSRAATASPEVRSLLDDAEALPPEFASDVLVQLVENGFIHGDRLKIKVLNSAFDKAATAQDDVMRRPFGANVEETPQGLHAIASTVTRLDRTSLQARVVHELISINRQRAVQVFESTQAPHVEPINCNQNWYFVPDSYYDALSLVVEQGFSAREIASGLRASYVSSIIKSTQSHVQLLPVAHLLTADDFTDKELREVVPAYAAALENLHGDPLSFYVLMARAEVFWDAIFRLTASLDKDVIDSRPLLHSLRDYLVLNFNGPNCGGAQASGNPNSPLPASVSEFDARFGGMLVRMGLGPIRGDEIRGLAPENVNAPAPSGWKSQAYAQMVQSLQGLNPPAQQESGKALGVAKENSQWSTEAEDLLNQISAWSDTSEAETVFFHQKAILMEGLAERTVGTSIHGRVRDGFITFLEQNSYQQVSRIDWFFYVRKLLSANARSGYATGDLEAFLNSRDPVLSTYARLELLLQKAKEAPAGARVGPK